jgi:hypothetical protein
VNYPALAARNISADSVCVCVPEMPLTRVKSVLGKTASRNNVKFSAQKIVSARKTQGKQIKLAESNLFPRRVIKSAGVCMLHSSRAGKYHEVDYNKY